MKTTNMVYLLNTKRKKQQHQEMKKEEKEWHK